MEADWDLLERIRAELDAAQNILIVSHVRPDGDAIGSVLGLGLSLMASGKNVQMVLSDGVPANFRFLVGSEKIKKQAKGNFDYRIVVDASEITRVGGALNGQSTPDLNVDHHVTNTLFARHNLVLNDAAATAEILARVMPSLKLLITPEIANALLTGVVTDTIGFRTGNVTPNVLRVAASLIEQGGRLSDVYYLSLIQRSYEAARFWGYGLKHLQREDGLVWTALTLEDRIASDYPGRDDADLVNVLSALDGADIAVIFVEQPRDCIKISWRVCGQAEIDADVSEVALKFGGGGHRAAAGADVTGSLQNVQEKVLHATQSYLNQMRAIKRQSGG